MVTAAPAQTLVRGPLGLWEVHRPSAPPVATIVCVHGLNGDSERTWTDLSVESPFFWLRAGLAQDFPRFRILSFGYERPVIRKTGIFLSPSDDARNLHALLERDIRESKSASPIVFIAHSLGGNIVKKVLTHSALSPFGTVHQHTGAVLFFGTPHRGSDTTSRADRILRLTAGISNIDPDFGHRELQITNESWLHIAHNYTVVSFYETVPMNTGISRMTIVRKDEATLNTPNEMIFALNTTHRDLVRFAGRDDPSYRSVCQVLKTIEHQFRDKPMVRIPAAPPTKPDEAPAEEPQRISFEGYVHGFGGGGLEIEETHSVSDLQEKSPSELLSTSKPREGAGGEPYRLFWIHIPLTNTAWVNPCLQSIAKSQETELLITDDKYWLSRERRSRSNLPHSRHFEPSSFMRTEGKTTQLVIYLPYIHWDTYKCFTKWSAYLSAANTGEPPDMPPDLPAWSQAVFSAMRDDCRKTSSLHPRRTLDQFFYSTLPETSARDSDQVVSKNTKLSHGGKKMVMVDQLWLWALLTGDSGAYETAVFTCFPRKYEEGENEEQCFHGIADLRQGVVDEVNGREGYWGAKWSNLVGLLLDQAVNAMLNVRNEQSLDFLGVFRLAIGKATEEQSGYFRKFQAKLSFGSSDDRKIKREEVQLALEITDILDELNSIDRLFEAQADALKALLENLAALADVKHEGYNPMIEAYRQLCVKVDGLIKRDIAGYRKQVKRMVEDARRTKDNLVELLDLQQKEETLREAQYSNQQAAAAQEQADATAAQSQILFLFTIVTIIFLPLSFFTSYFGMNVTELTGEEGNTAQAAVWKIMGPISGTVILGLLGAAFYMYKRTRRQQEARRSLVHGR